MLRIFKQDSELELWMEKDGAFVAPTSGGYLETSDPSTNKILGRIAAGNAADVDAAVAAARKAQDKWAKIGGPARARHLYALARAVQRHGRLFAVLESLDGGKPVRESRDIDIPLVARHFYHHAGWAQLQEREFADQVPVGVVGQIIPWNFPLLMLAWKLAPALALGNTVVLKPAEFTSLTALLFAEICQEAGLPKGVVNIVTGAGDTGRYLVEHPGVDGDRIATGGLHPGGADAVVDDADGLGDRDGAIAGRVQHIDLAAGADGVVGELQAAAG